MDVLEHLDASAMREPIERLFEREYEAALNVLRFGTEVGFSNGHAPEGLVDLIYVAGGREQLHGVRIRLSYDDCLFDIHDGIHTLGEARANYRWIALPLEAYREGEDEYRDIMHKTCEQRGFGIIAVQVKGRGLSAKIILGAERKPGNFLDVYEGLAQTWKQRLGSDEIIDGYQVVDYYDR
jgi:hypothetical protein